MLTRPTFGEVGREVAVKLETIGYGSWKNHWFKNYNLKFRSNMMNLSLLRYKTFVCLKKHLSTTGSSVGSSSFAKGLNCSSHDIPALNDVIWLKNNISLAISTWVQCFQHWRHRWAGLHIGRIPASRRSTVSALHKKATTKTAKQFWNADILKLYSKKKYYFFFAVLKPRKKNQKRQ